MDTYRILPCLASYVNHYLVGMTLTCFQLIGAYTVVFGITMWITKGRFKFYSIPMLAIIVSYVLNVARSGKCVSLDTIPGTKRIAPCSGDFDVGLQSIHREPVTSSVLWKSHRISGPL